MDSPQGKLILVVEDERVVAKDLQRSLINLGYDVPATAASSEEAIRLASERRPDLLLMDVRIKGERDGIGTAAVLREAFDVPVIYLTAHADAETIARAQVTEPQGYLLKPVKAEELRSAVQIALYKHEMGQRLREKERWLKTTLRAIDDAVICTDAEGAVTFVNLAAEALIGQGSTATQGQRVEDVLRLLDDRGEVQDPIGKALRERRAVAHDAMVVGRDGVERLLSYTASPLVEDDAAPTGVVLVLRDVTEQRKLRQKLELADRLASIGTLAAGVAHEINNPLAYVTLNIDIVARELRDPVRASSATRRRELSEVLDEARQGADRVAAIVRGLRTFARAEQEQHQLIDVGRAIDVAVSMTANEVKHRARFVRNDARVPLVQADESRLAQVFINLILNAAQAIDEGSAEKNEIRLTTRVDQKGDVVIEIQDTGPGIVERDRARIFDPFFTTKPVGAGTGLGLSICHGIVESLGGEITFDSVLGEGTTFRVVLPAADGAALIPRDSPLAPSPDGAPARRGRVLIVDNEPFVVGALERILGGDHEVTTATSGRAALDRFEGGERFDVVLCDLMMPDITGMDLHAELLRLAPDQAQRMVFVTGGAFTARARAFLDEVSNPRLDKPFDAATIHSIVAGLVAP